MHSTTAQEELLNSLIHDLRQPLANLETSLFYLDLVLNPASQKIREQLQTMERQVARAAALLQQAAEETRVLRDQRTAAESLALTNSATAGVT